MQMQSVETNAGIVICWAPSRIARLELLALLQVPVDVLDRHDRVVHQDADGEREAAERHDVDRLAEGAAGTMIEARMDSGIDTAMITRAAPAAEQDEDHQRRQARGDDALPARRRRSTARTNSDWSDSWRTVSSGGRLAADPRQRVLDAIDDVERRGVPGLQDRHQRRRAGRPRARCSSAAGCRRARWPRRGCRWARRSTTWIGRSFSSSIVCGLALMRTSYSNAPIFELPAGRIRFCAADRVDHVERRQALRPAARRGSRSTWICGCLPPYG